jgi:hypothetical protein
LEAKVRSELNALHEIRDIALMLSLGNVYLCEEPFLKKIGHAVDRVLEDLHGEILSLKKRFPGQFAQDIDTDAILDDFHAKAEQLQNADAAINAKCGGGQLGRELEEMVSTLTAAVKEVTFKVEGKLPGSARRYSLLSLFNPFKALGRLVSTFSSLVVKLALFIIILAIGPFAYLFISMEKEGSIQKAIDQSRAYIQTQRQTIVSLDQERAEIAKQIEAMRLREDELSRQEKIEIMEINVKAHALDQKRQAIEVEIASHEDKIAKNLEKIEEVKKKSFLQRLFRR